MQGDVMAGSGRARFRRAIAVGAAVGMLATAGGVVAATSAVAKAKACKKGFVRKGTKCVRKAAATTTTKKAITTTTTAAPTVAAKGTILLGTLGTTIQATSGARTTEATRKMAQVWTDQVNAAGGINGYKVKMQYEDTRGDTARTLAAIKTLDKAGVLAIVGPNSASNITGSDDYITAASLPIVGGNPHTPEFDSHPMFFPVSASYYAGVYGQVAAARDAGAKYFRNMFCVEVAACAQSVPVTNAAAQREGLKGDAVGASAVALDYTANCISAKQAGVDFLQLNGMNPANFVRDCQRQNYHPTYAIGGVANQASIDNSQGENLVGNLDEFGIFYNGPEVQRFKKALLQTDLNVGATPPNQESIEAWLGFEMAGKAVAKLTQTNPTRADFLNALYQIKGETLEGQIAPADYTQQKLGAGHHAFNDCWTEHLVQDGKYFHMNKQGQIVTKLTYICGTGHQYG
jgi:branched-chain amino acid transport system substrate-binding protein